MAALGVVATTRASFYVYTTPDDVDHLVDGLHKARRVFGLAPPQAPSARRERQGRIRTHSTAIVA